MSIVQRRVFYAKVGKADELVEALRQGDKLMEQAGLNTDQRILTDYLSGRTDRVVSEIEIGSLGDLESMFERAMSDAAIQVSFSQWFSKVSELVTHAKVENWAVR